MSIVAALPVEPSRAGGSRSGVLRWQDTGIKGIRCKSANIRDAQGRGPAIERREFGWLRLQRFAAFAPVFRTPGIPRVESPRTALLLGVSFQLPQLHSPTLHLTARQASQKFNPRPLPGAKQLVRFRFPVAHNDPRSAASAKPSSHCEGLRYGAVSARQDRQTREREPQEDAPILTPQASPEMGTLPTPTILQCRARCNEASNQRDSGSQPLGIDYLA